MPKVEPVPREFNLRTHTVHFGCARVISQVKKEKKKKIGGDLEAKC